MSAAWERKHAVRFETPRVLDGSGNFFGDSGVYWHGQDRNTKATGSGLKKNFCRVIPVKQDPKNIFAELC